uniref:Uncharacterized protein n=1 Tax=Siphoviridae sp. ctTnV63 TaxID=2825523 RepID=A0A8S5NUW2_9CAUD|nr:MAG TPA: hypothetical protein [Siphoviridae sp. ctTnV63]
MGREGEGVRGFEKLKGFETRVSYFEILRGFENYTVV